MAAFCIFTMMLKLRVFNAQTIIGKYLSFNITYLCTTRFLRVISDNYLLFCCSVQRFTDEKIM